jgi:D-glycero-D-manno-heptose 1,7-bisphosphate phosphatase
MRDSAIFFDRDGVINYDHGYVYKREDFDFIEGIFDVARHAHKLNYKLVVITNQAGIARGYYTEEQFHQLTAWMCQKFLVAGAPINRVYFSPYHPTAGLGRYLKDDFNRKPNPGMILQAQQELSIELSRSILIGDKMSDIQAGTSAGVGTNLLFSGECSNKLGNLKYDCITSLHEAIPYFQQGLQ